MPETAAKQLSRVLNLIPRLADGEDHPLSELASEPEVTTAEQMADFLSISERFDAPAGFVDGVSIFVEDGKVSVNASHFERPMRLTMPELCALELGLMLLRPTRNAAERAPIEGALEKLSKTVSRVPATDRHEGIRFADLLRAGSEDHLATLRTAVAECRKVRIRYRASRATESRDRDICPHSLVFMEQMWYVFATNEEGNERVFRLDRMESVSVLSETFEPDPAIVARAHAEGRAFVFNATKKMTVYYSPKVARWVAEREGKKLAADGSLTMEHAVADEGWAIRHVLQYGKEAVILEPEELRRKMAETLGGA